MAIPTGQVSKSSSYSSQIEYNLAFPLSTGAITTVGAQALFIDARKIDNSVIVIHNPDGVITENYAIYGSILDNPNFTDVTQPEWVNLKSVAGGVAYNHTFTNSVIANAKAVESFTNPYAWIIISINSASGTPNVNVYHRGSVSA